MDHRNAHQRTAFHWPVYADATFAGLSVLIPVPLVDLFFERWFLRRMPRTIARYHGRKLQPDVAAIFNRGRGCSGTTCLLVPLWVLYKLLERLSKKILYFLTVKEAVDSLSHNWHRAFLFNEMLLSGHLEGPASAGAAQQAMEETLAEIGTSPFTQLAREVIGRARHVFRSLWRVLRRGKEDEMVAEERALIGSSWSDFDSYLASLASRYHEAFATLHDTPGASPVAQ